MLVRLRRVRPGCVLFEALEGGKNGSSKIFGPLWDDSCPELGRHQYGLERPTHAPARIFDGLDQPKPLTRCIVDVSTANTSKTPSTLYGTSLDRIYRTLLYNF